MHFKNINFIDYEPLQEQLREATRGMLAVSIAGQRDAADGAFSRVQEGAQNVPYENTWGQYIDINLFTGPEAAITAAVAAGAQRPFAFIQDTMIDAITDAALTDPTLDDTLPEDVRIATYIIENNWIANMCLFGLFYTRDGYPGPNGHEMGYRFLNASLRNNTGAVTTPGTI